MRWGRGCAEGDCITLTAPATLPAMLAKLKPVLLLLLVLFIGAVVGWFLQGGMSATPMSPVTEDADGQDEVQRPSSRHGYCCTAPGQECEEMESPVACFGVGGRAFNTDLLRCSTYCVNAAPAAGPSS